MGNSIWSAVFRGRDRYFVTFAASQRYYIRTYDYSFGLLNTYGPIAGGETTVAGTRLAIDHAADVNPSDSTIYFCYSAEGDTYIELRRISETGAVMETRVVAVTTSSEPTNDMTLSVVNGKACVLTFLPGTGLRMRRFQAAAGLAPVDTTTLGGTPGMNPQNGASLMPYGDSYVVFTGMPVIGGGTGAMPLGAYFYRASDFGLSESRVFIRDSHKNYWPQGWAENETYVFVAHVDSAPTDSWSSDNGRIRLLILRKPALTVHDSMELANTLPETRGAMRPHLELKGDSLILTYDSGTTMLRAYRLTMTFDPDTTGPNAWYVNDTSIVGDSFTSAVGSDANNGLSPSTPKRTITSVANRLTTGDTVYIDAGTYVESVVITADNISMIGVDSMLTVIDPPDSWDSSGSFGIYADTQSGLLIRSLRVYDVMYGIRWINVDSSFIDNVTCTYLGYSGIYFEHCDSTLLRANLCGGAVNGIVLYTTSTRNTILNNTCRDNDGGAGIWLEDGSNYNTVQNNTCLSSLWGIWCDYSHNNLITGNYCANNITYMGMELISSNNNVVSNNVLYNNQYGLSVSNSENNVFTQNSVDSFLLWGIDVSGTSRNDTFTKNIIVTPYMSESAVIYDTRFARFDFTRNWWGTTDSQSIRGRIENVGGDSIRFVPFRLSIVDTAAGADTVAPRAPDTVTATALGSASIRVAWTAVTTSEESESAVNLAGYRVWRSTTAETSLWTAVGTSPTAAFDDTSGLSASTAYYYRVTSYDNASISNQSWYSDSTASATTAVDTSGPNAWYVNDSATTGDSYSTAAGDNANTGITATAPKRTLTALTGLLSAGDTVYIDSGIWNESFLTAGVDSISFLGVDSANSIISMENIWETALIVRNASGVAVRNLCFLYAQWDGTSAAGLFLDSVASARVVYDSFGANDAGIRVANGSRDVRISRCAFAGNQYAAVHITLSDSNLVENSSLANGIIGNQGADSNTYTGNSVSSASLYVDSGAGTTISLNTLSSSSIILGAGAVRSTIESNTISGGKIELQSGADTSTVRNNTSHYIGDNGVDVNSNGNTIDSNSVTGSGAGGYGIRVFSGANGNLLRRNTATGKRNYGYLIQGTGNRIEDNVARACQDGGFRTVTSADSTIFSGNLAENSDGGGYSIECPGNYLIGNIARNNSGAGFTFSTCTGTFFSQNHADSNFGCGIIVAASAGPCTFARSIISVPPGRPDSGVLVSMNNVTFNRFWWGSTDSSSIYSVITGTGKSTARYMPYRLGLIDTSVSADSVGPAIPTGVSADTGTYGRIRFSFTPPGANEDSIAGSLGIAGYRLYRSSYDTVTDWGTAVAETSNAAATYVDDTTALNNTRYYYRVTVIDNASRVNESFYTDTAVAGPVTRTPGDFDGSSPVSATDLILLRPRYMVPALYSAFYDIAPVPPDGVINLLDFLELGKRFGQ